MNADDGEELQRVEALMIDIHLEILYEICHACSKPATWKGKWMLPLYLLINQKSDDPMMIHCSSST